MSMTDRSGNLQAAATRLGGTLSPGLWDGDHLDFTVDSTLARLAYFTGRREYPPFTEVRFDQVPEGRLRIFPEGLFASIRKMFGAQDIQTCDPTFDRAFMVQGLPERWVREILDQETRQRIQALAALGQSLLGGSAVGVEVGPSGVTITCGRCLVGDGTNLEAFLDHSVALFKRVRAPRPDGINILQATVGTSRGACPVCASAIDSDVQPCPTCAALHHVDCWKYFGGCAIYGCRGGRGRPG